MFKNLAKSKIDRRIFDIYYAKKKRIKKAAQTQDAELCMELIYDIWMFMNRFRNCDLQFYYDEELHYINSTLNQKRFDIKCTLLRPKKTFRIAFLMASLVDTGGASIPHRFILENQVHLQGYYFEQYLLVTNLGRKDTNFLKETHQHKYIKEKMNFTEYEILPPMKSWVERGIYIENWLYEREIDFVVVDPEPSILYALTSDPVLIKGILSQDCYTFTLGPGAGDVTFLITTDQIFKYRFNHSFSNSSKKVVLLPLHEKGYVENAEPLNLEEFGITKKAVVSATTNMWKSCFGDNEIFLEGIATLVRKYPHYHHIFAGTSRCLDNVEFFIHKNQDIKNNIHYIGPVMNIYRLLKSIDFYINSFPTSGGSNIESAMVGKPTIEFVWNRNLTFHGIEFLHCPECEVYTFDEFVDLGSRMIKNPDYTQNLGLYLQQKVIEELDKNKIIKKCIYNYFIEEFNKKLSLQHQNRYNYKINLTESVEYEKHIALFNSYIRKACDLQEQCSYLEKCISDFPYKPFAWIKCFEIAISSQNRELFIQLTTRVPSLLKNDHRLLVMLSIGYKNFGNKDKALEMALDASKLAIHDEIPARITARLLAAAKRNEEAVFVLSNAKIGHNINIDEVEAFLAKLPSDDLPLYYDY